MPWSLYLVSLCISYALPFFRIVLAFFSISYNWDRKEAKEGHFYVQRRSSVIIVIGDEGLEGIN